METHEEKHCRNKQTYKISTHKGLIDNLKAATGDIADDLMACLQAHEVPLTACTPCVKARQFSAKDLIDGALLGTAVGLIQLTSNAAVICL